MVMAVIAVMFAVVGPLLGNFAIGRKTHNAATQLVALAKYARYAAIQDGRIYRMTFDTAGRTVSVEMQDGSQFVQPPSSLADPVKLEESLTLRTDLTAQQNGQTYVDFHPDGRSGDGPVHVWVTDKKGGIVELACESPTELFHVLSAQETTKQ